MNPADLERQHKYLANLRNNLIHELGGFCQYPGCAETLTLQFHHVQATQLKGEGRGKKRRLLDVKNHPAAYCLLCEKHHNEIHDKFGDLPIDPRAPEVAEVCPK